jgi:hypothetical protein
MGSITTHLTINISDSINPSRFIYQDHNIYVCESNHDAATVELRLAGEGVYAGHFSMSRDYID